MNRYKNKIIDIANNRNFTLLPIITPSFILGRANYHCFKTKLIKLKNYLNKLCSVQESFHTDKQIRYYTELRCQNYTTDQVAFISSALEREKRKIILDRVLVQRNGQDHFLTDASEIKKEVALHFQTAAKLLPLELPTMTAR